MRLQHNERKIVLLDYASHLEEFSAAEVAQDLALSLASAQVYCFRYYRQKLLSRWKEARAYHYSISRKGRSRLDYLEETMPEVFACLTSPGTLSGK